MSRGVLSFVVVALLMWRASVAWALPPLTAALGERLSHELAHAQALDHHHHADTSLHFNEAGDDHLPHQHAAEGAQPADLHRAPSLAVHTVPAVAPAADAPPAMPAVFLAGPLRPPRHSV